MTDLPTLGTRVSLRYRLPDGSAPPHTDVVGHVVEIGPTVRVRIGAPIRVFTARDLDFSQVS